MSKGLIQAGQVWVAKKSFNIGMRKIITGQTIRIHCVMAYVDKAFIQILVNSYIEILPVSKFRDLFKREGDIDE